MLVGQRGLLLSSSALVIGYIHPTDSRSRCRCLDAEITGVEEHMRLTGRAARLSCSTQASAVIGVKRVQTSRTLRGLGETIENGG